MLYFNVFNLANIDGNLLLIVLTTPLVVTILVVVVKAIKEIILFYKVK
jgi:hypothetical protein